MKIRVYHDETIDLRIDEVIVNLNRLAPEFLFTLGKARFSLPADVIVNPDAYRALDYRIGEESASDDMVLLFTSKPYDNNYFWDSDDDKKIIVSLFGWEHLTDLSQNNGAVYFICALIVRHLGIGKSHQKKDIGCINDFWGDKTGIDRGMRVSYICESCIKQVNAKSVRSALTKLKGVLAVMDDLGAASRAGKDLCDTWSAASAPQAFDVFICHNSLDKPAVRDMNRRLQAQNIRTWLDEEQLPPGRAWQDLLEVQIEGVKSAGIFVGGSGIGPWQNVEMRAFLQEFVRRQCPVIPVILPGCLSVPKLPLFLSQLTWVDFRKSEPEPFERLLWGITGKRPV